MVFNRQALCICAVFIAICLLQLGRIAASDSLESDTLFELFMSKVGPVIGIIGLVGTVLTFPIMLIASVLDNIMNSDGAIALLYMLLGIAVILSKVFRSIFPNTNNITLGLYLTVFSISQFIFDYASKIRDNKIAAGQLRPDALDLLGTMIFFSFIAVISFAISLIVTMLTRREK